MRISVKYRTILFVIGFCIAKASCLFAQEGEYQVIKGLPTNEVYDLMVDSKGLLWIAHDLGLSTYDGKTFRNYSCKEQKAKAITGLLEDKYGRVWCHNFSSQVFWIKDDVMHLLKEYKAEDEPFFPQITILKDELIATSKKGLFAYNLKTGHTKCISLPAAHVTFSPIGGRLIGIVNPVGSWFSYNGNKPEADILKFAPSMPSGNTHRSLSLQLGAKGDEIFAIDIVADACFRYRVLKDSICYVSGFYPGTFINNVTANGKDIWVHTKTASYLIDGKEKITGYDLTDIVTDKEGNTWMSSLKYGLMMQPASHTLKIPLKIPLSKGDYIRTMKVIGNKVLWGTQNGDIFLQDRIGAPGHTLASWHINSPIEQFYVSDSDKNNVFVRPSVGAFLLNIKKENKAPELLYEFYDNSAKQVAFYNGVAAICTNIGLMFSPDPWRKFESNWWTHIQYQPLRQWRGSMLACWESQRCRSAAFASFNNAILASFKDGVMEFKEHRDAVPVIFNGQRVDARELLSYKDKIFIVTARDELLVYSRSGIHAMTSDELLQSRDILLVKLVEDQLWIISNYGIKIIDADTEKVAGYYELPGVNLAGALTVEYAGDKALLVMNNGVYELPVNKSKQIQLPSITLQYAIANGKDTVVAGKPLRHNQSDLRFYVSVPWYASADAVTIAYRLMGDNDSSWQYISRSDQPIHYASLAPGNYIFEVKVIHRLSGSNSDVKRLGFEIRKPWWQLTSFWICVSLLAISIVIFVVRKYYAARLQKQKRFYEQELALEKERQRISADIHDELGGTLSGIKLMAEMTERKYDESGNIKGDLHNIHTSVSTLSQKMREVIWSLNNENNSLENLLDYLLRRGKEMFQNSDIQFHSQLPQNIPVVQLKGDKRRHIYLAVKEALHNALKHSNATDVYLSFEFNTSTLNITVSDNGGGFITSSNMHGNGIKNMHARMEQVNGLLLMSKEDGITLTFVAPLVSSAKQKN